MRKMWLMAAGFLLAGCQDPGAPTGPPHCEPPEELVIERTLKTGYRAAAEGDFEGAERAFREALDLASDHPEALAGQRLVEELRRGPIRREAPKSPEKAPDGNR
jgi:hypothetical protein